MQRRPFAVGLEEGRGRVTGHVLVMMRVPDVVITASNSARGGGTSEGVTAAICRQLNTDWAVALHSIEAGKHARAAQLEAALFPTD